MRPLDVLDDHLLAAAQRFLAAARRIGMDKWETGRDIHVLKLVFAVAGGWYAIGGSVLLGPLLVSGFLAGCDWARICDLHRRIGSADTVRGWEKAAKEAAASLVRGRRHRMFALARTVAFAGSAVWMMASGYAGRVGPVPVVSCFAVHGLLAVAAWYLKAVPPPPPTTLRREDDIPMRVTESLG